MTRAARIADSPLAAAQPEFDAAEALFREVLAARRRVLPGDHPDRAVSLNNLAVVLLDRREFLEASDLLREAIALQRRVLPPGHPNLAGSLVNLGAALVELRDYEQAEQVLREGVEIREQQLASAHPSTGVARLLLGLSMQGQGRFDEGTALVEEGSRVVLASGAPRQKRTALDRIVRAYESWNRDEAAVVYRTQLAELQAADTPP
ncbi:MAG: tetratricopeptide repeat-containing protein [Planctomycetia bacterium]|nr:MAG: tetratricopeptide repeat-containing protein [Planctomycetia bacterium]